MRNGFLASTLAILFAGGVALSQTAAPKNPAGTDESSEGWTPIRPADAKNSPAPPATTTEPVKSLPAPSACPAPGPTVGPAPGRCGPPYRYWASAEYLLWWTKSDSLPPLVTSGTGTGVLGQPGTVVLFGGDVDYGVQQGIRLTAGMWLDECNTKGLEASTFCLLSESDDFAAVSPGLPVLARPFIDATTGLQGSQLIAFPGLLAGGVNVSSFSKLKGCEVNAICNCKCCYDCDNGCYWQGGRLDVLAGVRYLELREGLTITENIIVPAGVPALGTFPNIGGLPLAAGDRIGVEDRFRTENRFYGVQVGLRGEYAFGNGVFVNATGKLAFGVMQQEIDIRGVTAVATPTGAVVAAGGLLAQPTNMGNFERDRWAIVPELNVSVGFQVDQNVRVFVGYTYLAATNVVRPGDVIDPVVNPTRVPTSLVPATGAGRPALIVRDSAFWAQGISIGAEVRY